jgi:RES domain-containing protein
MKEVTWSGRLYRALNPVYAREPLSGRGAALYGGRFNPKGMPALYASSSVMTALREANQVGDLQPTTLVCYRAEIEAVFDARRATNLAAWGMDEAALADPSWRDAMRRHGEARTQKLARELVADGYNAMIVRSFAKGAAADDANLVLWRWGDGAPARLTLIDDEQRLG